MKNRFVFVLLLLLSMTASLAEDTVTIDLVQGRNVVVINDYFPSVPVSFLMNDNPSVESVTLDVYGQRFGFVNVFGGVGTDFLFEQGVEYEIFVSQDTTLVLGVY